MHPVTAWSACINFLWVQQTDKIVKYKGDKPDINRCGFGFISGIFPRTCLECLTIGGELIGGESTSWWRLCWLQGDQIPLNNVAVRVSSLR